MYRNYELLRNKKGLKDSDVARITGIAKSTFSDWKADRSTPKLPKLQKIAECLECNISDIISEHNISYDEDTHTWEYTDEGYYANEGAAELAEFLHKNPDYKVLFDASKKVKREDLSKALKAIGIFIDEE